MTQKVNENLTLTPIKYLLLVDDLLAFSLVRSTYREPIDAFSFHVPHISYEHLIA